MHFRLRTGWIENSGFECLKEETTTTTEISTTTTTSTTTTATTTTKTTKPTKTTPKTTPKITTTAPTTKPVTTTTAKSQMAQCRYLPKLGNNMSWGCYNRGNTCRIDCKTSVQSTVIVNCKCSDASSASTCYYDVEKDGIVGTLTLSGLISRYNSISKNLKKRLHLLV